MDQRRRQKERERIFVEHFLEVVGRPDLIPDLKEDEGPDFRGLAPEGLVGIEVTELFREAPPGEVPRQAREGGWAQVAFEAERLWKQRGWPFVVVSLFFHPRHHLSQRSAGPLAARIVDLVDRYLPEPDSCTLVRRIEHPYGEVPVELVHLGIARSSKFTRSSWGVDDAGWEGILAPEQVQAAIDAKRLDAKAYRQSFDSVWLVLVIHQGRISSDMGIPEETASCMYDIPFDRAFLFSTADERVIELQQAVGPGQPWRSSVNG
ncbi:MAG: hypothetical protein JXM73_02465 [Anaerolineae bacterium]|nr:hypothetical protein [Anaerolineae bacterium]